MVMEKSKWCQMGKYLRGLSISQQLFNRPFHHFNIFFHRFFDIKYRKIGENESNLLYRVLKFEIHQTRVLILNLQNLQVCISTF